MPSLGRGQTDTLLCFFSPNVRAREALLGVTKGWGMCLAFTSPSTWHLAVVYLGLLKETTILRLLLKEELLKIAEPLRFVTRLPPTKPYYNTWGLHTARASPGNESPGPNYKALPTPPIGWHRAESTGTGTRTTTTAESVYRHSFNISVPLQRHLPRALHTPSWTSMYVPWAAAFKTLFGLCRFGVAHLADQGTRTDRLRSRWTT